MWIFVSLFQCITFTTMHNNVLRKLLHKLIHNISLILCTSIDAFNQNYERLMNFIFMSMIILLPPKLYLVVFYQLSLVNQAKIICSNFRRPSEVLLGSVCCTISHVNTPYGSCNKMFQNDSVCKRLGLLDFICQFDQPRVFFPLVIIGC